MLKRFGVLSLVLAGATLLQPTAIFAEGVFHNGKNTTVVQRKTDARGERDAGYHEARTVVGKRVETRVVRPESIRRESNHRDSSHRDHRIYRKADDRW
jgi:hypothetical protein